MKHNPNTCDHLFVCDEKWECNCENEYGCDECNDDYESEASVARGLRFRIDDDREWVPYDYHLKFGGA
ncbi:hypothetical protein ACFQZE_07280 [Paenibacillus sp. GCM10027627]|uniref:hypothetical protein n=1 Tax=unclassified Paenibacillus TaxID=185978 RepID=UPI00363D2602